MIAITKERAEIKSFITGFLSDPAHDNQSSNSLIANVFRIALASLEAEPVSQTYKLNELSDNSPVTQDGWISCSERMPEETGDIIVACSDGIVMSGVSYSRRKGFYMASWGYEDDEPVTDVTYWMPLPEPPQE